MEANAKKFFSSVAISGLEAVTAKRRYLTKCEPKVMEIDDEEKIVKTACRACIANCGVLAHVKNGRVIKLEGNPVKYREVLGFSTQERLNTLIHDIIEQSWEKNEICMSPDVAQAMQGLRQFMFQNVYTNPVAKGEETKAKELLERLFVYYLKHIDLLPGYYLQMLEDGEENDRVVCDYIAGMTDQYALAKYSEYFMPKSWQVY